MIAIKDFDAPRNCVNCQNEGLSEIVGCGLFDECGKHPDCPLVEIGTCKDCFYYAIDEDGHGYHCEKYGHTRFPVYADFYCADFEKRGNENESIN